MARRGPAPELPKAYETAVGALVEAIEKGEMHTKQDRYVQMVEGQEVTFSLERTANKFVLSFRVGDGGGWQEGTEQSGGDLVEKASRLYQEVARLHSNGAFESQSGRRTRVPALTPSPPMTASTAAQSRMEVAAVETVPAATDGVATARGADDRGSFQCPGCSKTYKKQTWLDKHVRECQSISKDAATLAADAATLVLNAVAVDEDEGDGQPLEVGRRVLVRPQLNKPPAGKFNKAAQQLRRIFDETTESPAELGFSTDSLVYYENPSGRPKTLSISFGAAPASQLTFDKQDVESAVNAIDGAMREHDDWIIDTVTQIDEGTFVTAKGGTIEIVNKGRMWKHLAASGGHYVLATGVNKYTATGYKCWKAGDDGSFEETDGKRLKLQEVRHTQRINPIHSRALIACVFSTVAGWAGV